MDCSTGGDLAAQAQPPLAAAELSGAEAATELPDAQAVACEPDAEQWRREVAARLEHYRSRRKPRQPRYPSLHLPFDSADNHASPSPATAPAPATSPATPAFSQQNVALQLREPDCFEATPLPELRISIAREPEPSNLIEFPRSAAIPVYRADELAEPVLNRPRIVEAPEVVPPPPALGGILIDPLPDRRADKRAAGEFPRQPASLLRRLLAGLVDALILALALAASAAIFHQLNPARIPIPLAAAALLAVAGLLWAGYEFLFVVYTGSTPGLRVARLRLARFDGSAVRRPRRRWRVLASFLSALSLGLGYLWSILDEDGLCWHDRITRTYMESSTSHK